MITFNELLACGLLMLAIGVMAGVRASRRANYDRGYNDGHTQGVLDAVSWRCGCGHRNQPNTVMCGHCGGDRFPSFIRESRPAQNSNVENSK